MNMSMNSAARSIVAYGVYLILAIALPFLFLPTVLLPLVGMAPPTDVWIRVLGMSVLFFGFYYIQAGRHNLTEFFRWTIYGRYAVPLFFIAERMFCFVILSASSVLPIFSIVMQCIPERKNDEIGAY